LAANLLKHTKGQKVTCILIKLIKNTNQLQLTEQRNNTEKIDFAATYGSYGTSLTKQYCEQLTMV